MADDTPPAVKTPLPPAPAGPAADTVPAEPAREYEFSAEHNKLFADLAESLIFFGWFVGIVVVVFHAAGLVRWAVDGVPPYDRFRVIQVLWPALVLVICVKFVATGRAFRRVTETAGSDIAHLTDGLRALAEGFNWLTIVPRLWIVFGLIAAMIGLVIAGVHALGY